MLSLHSLTPSTTLDVAGTSARGAAANLDFGSLSFGAMFKGQVDAQSSDAPAAPDASDPAAQIAALLQSGMPLSTLVDRIANLIASAVQQTAPDALKGGIDRQALQNAIAKAIHPPGNAPPESLGSRLRRWIEAIENPTDVAGQKNELSGTILDAKSAKDIPAQAQESKPQSTLVDAGQLASSLIALASSGQTPNDAAPPVSAPSAQPSADASQSQQPPNAPDLLARMLVRAASVDERVNGNAPVSVASTPATTALAAKFAATLQTLVALAAPQLRKVDLTQPVAERAANDSPQLGIGSMQSFTHIMGEKYTMPVAIAHPVDAHAIVEQLVKSMVMRTDAQGTSQIRLHLSPAHLGDLSMKITVQGGTISASVVAQNADVRNALVSNQHHLARSLADSGLSLAGFSVDVSGGDARSRQDRDRTAGFGRRFVVHELGAQDEPDAATIPSLGPTLLPNSSLGLFNYLA